MTIEVSLILTICSFIGVMYGLARLFNVIDYCVRNSDKKDKKEETLIEKINNCDDPNKNLENTLNLKIWE